MDGGPQILTAAGQDLEALVGELYKPGKSSSEVDRIQKELQAYQLSPQGWQIATTLLKNSDTKVGFFGALTFSVKLNQDGASLTDDELNQVLETLVTWTVNRAARSGSDLVLRKISSCLVTLFLLQNSTWTNPIQYLTCSLANNQLVVTTETDLDLAEILRRLDDTKLSLLLKFATDLAQDAGRLERSNVSNNNLHTRTLTNIDAATAVMHDAFRRLYEEQEGDYKYHVNSCFEAWIQYTSLQLPGYPSNAQGLRVLIIPMFRCLKDDDLYESTASVLTDVFISQSEILTKAEKDTFFSILDSQWAKQHMHNLEVVGEDPDSILFGQLVFAFAQYYYTDLLEPSPESRLIKDYLFTLTACQNFDTADPVLFSACADYWESFIFDMSDDFNIDDARDIWLEALQTLCMAACLPIVNGEFQSILAEEPFSDFRGRVKDLVENSYSTYGYIVMEKLVGIALSAYEPIRTANNDSTGSIQISKLNRSLSMLEVAFFAFLALSDSTDYLDDSEGAEDAIVQRLFTSTMFFDLTNFNSNVLVPIRLRKLVIKMLSSFDSFLKRHVEYIPAALQVFFSGLQHVQYAETSARSIASLCDSNRVEVRPLLHDLLASVELFFSTPQADAESKEPLIAALAAVIQSLESDEAKIEPLNKLLSIVEHNYEELIKHPTQDLPDTQSIATSTLRQLKRAGRGLQVPSDEPINLDRWPESSIWEQGAGYQIQQRILRILQVILQAHSGDGVILESACAVIKTGYRETHPGPFVFAPSVTIDLIVATPINHTRLDVALSTATMFISTHSSASHRSDTAAIALFEFVCTAIHYQSHNYDPDVSNMCLEFLQRLSTPTYAINLLLAPSKESIMLCMTFSIKALINVDVLPRRSAAAFWTTLLGNDMQEFSEEASQALKDILQTFGPTLAIALINNFGGNASRSELDHVAEPFRMMVKRQPMAKQWILEALKGTSFPSNRVDDATKMRFLGQVMSLRGDKKTNAIIKDFWLACRGTPTGYG